MVSDPKSGTGAAGSRLSRLLTARSAFRGLVGLAGLATLAAVPFLGVMPTLGSADIALPVVEVVRGTFTHTIDAEGVLVAEQVTLLRTPRAVNGPLRIGWLAPDGSDVEAGAPVIRFDATDMEKELHEGQANRSKADSRMTKQRVEQETASQNLQRDADLAGQQLEHAREFQNDDAELFSRIAIIESEIDSTLATERRDHATATMTRREGLGSVELDLLALERQRADLTIERAEAGLAQLEVTAPHDGIFVLSRDRGDIAQVGQSIWPGQPIAEIPQLDSMKADVFVLEADAGGIGVGKRASVVLEAHPDVEFDARCASRICGREATDTVFSGAVLRRRAGARSHRSCPHEARPSECGAVLEVERLDDVLSIPAGGGLSVGGRRQLRVPPSR